MKWLLLFSLLFSASFVDSSVTEAAPKKFNRGNKYYDGGASGLGDFMDDLHKENPKVHSRLLGDYRSIRNKVIISDVFYYGGFAVAATGVVLGLTTRTSSGGSNFSLAFIGIAVGAGAQLASWFIAPGRREYLNFVNKHNELNPSRPLELVLEVDPTPNSEQMMAGLAIRL